MTRPTRILANRVAAQLVTSYEVLRQYKFPAHLPIRIELDCTRLKAEVQVIKQPAPYPPSEVPKDEEEEKEEEAARIRRKWQGAFDEARSGKQASKQIVEHCGDGSRGVLRVEV